MKGALIAICAAFCAASVPASALAERPKLVVVIAVDQLSADLFAQYRQHFSGGLKRLSEGVVFPSGYQGHAATETCPGHSTILTGSRPSRTGIIANHWFDLRAAREDKSIYCAEDERVPGSSSEKYTLSPVHLKVPVLGDYMKAADPRSRAAIVTGKDRAAMMLGGRNPDQRWWWSGKGFAGNGAESGAAAQVNSAVADALARPSLSLPDWSACRARSRRITVPGVDQSLGEGRFARQEGDARGFRTSPELDSATLALGAALQEEMKLGAGPSTDLLALSLSATDYVGHAYGTQGREMCLQLLALDRSLGDFFDHLDESGFDYLVVLTADHGGRDFPERLREHGLPGAERVDPLLTAEQLGRLIGKRLGLSRPVLFGDGASGDIYIDRQLAPNQREQVLREALAAYRSHPQVAAVFTDTELKETPSPPGTASEWTLRERARASFDPDRSGDLIVLLKPLVSLIAQPGPGRLTGHATPWDHDRRVPIMFWRRGMAPLEQPAAVETADILPTIAAVIKVAVPGPIDGRCLDLLAGPHSSCVE